MAARLAATGMQLLVIDTGETALEAAGMANCAPWVAFPGPANCAEARLRCSAAESRYLSRGFAQQLAAAAGGRYTRLPNALDASVAIAAATGAAMAEARL